MRHTTDVVIIGGGVIGCAIAYYLRQQHIAVTVLERKKIGGQASGAASGLLAPLGPLSGPGPFADLLLSGFKQFPTLVPELEEASGVTIGYTPAGALRTVRHPKHRARLRKRMESWAPLGLSLSWLTGDEARQLEPGLSPEILAAVYVPEESQLDAPNIVKAFAYAAINRGARIHEHEEVVAIQLEHARVEGVQTASGDVFTCRELVIATGAWTAQFGEWFDARIPVQPLRGQSLLLGQSSPPLRHIIFGEAAYLSPKGEHILVGATREDVGFDTQVTEEGTSWLHATAERLVPSLHDQPIVRAWAGLRPHTPDSRPILGPLPGWENVSVASGHNSVGILLSPITGQSIATFIASGQLAPVLRPFSPQRFSS